MIPWPGTVRQSSLIPGPQSVAAGILLLFASSVLAQSSSQNEAELSAQLDAVRAEIAAIQSRLSDDLSERDSALDRLADADREVSGAERARRETQERIEQVESEIEALDDQRSRLESALSEVGQQLAQQLNFVYQQGSQSRLKILLNQDDPRQLNRQLAYQGYLSRRRLDVVEELQATALALESNRIELVTTQERLQRLANQQDSNIRQLGQARQDREAALEVIEQRVQSQQEELVSLLEDERELARLLDQLAASLADIPPDADVPGIADLRGELPRPIGGQPRFRFGERRSGELTWNGWLIPAPSGTDVAAIGHGRVAYADWLRGYGLILIIDHGDGFMSLYAHNEALLRDVGDWVNPGEVIASVGNTGGVELDGLYFELRRNGDPVNPANWLE
ncbi:MAG: peptidoglycan DD-metalloendopeptidase family protein [Pseudomonadota bacterium]